MRGERALLGIGEYLVGRACRRLPREIRDERYREWAAELPAILHDREIRLAPYRAVRMLGYAADTLRGTALAPGRARRRATLLPSLLLIAALVNVVWAVWDAVRAPGHGANYVLVAWSLVLVAWSVSHYARPGPRIMPGRPAGHQDRAAGPAPSRSTRPVDRSHLHQEDGIRTREYPLLTCLRRSPAVTGASWPD